MSPDIGDRRRAYCHWHFVALTHPTFATDFDEFERWNARFVAYCSVENHHPLVLVWNAITGYAPISGEPHACGNISCRYANAQDVQHAARSLQQRHLRNLAA